MDSREEEHQRGSLFGISEMRLSEGSIQMGPFYNEACWALFVSLEEEKEEEGAYIGAFFIILFTTYQFTRR